MKKKKTKQKKEEKDMGIIDDIMGRPPELATAKEAPKPTKEEHKAKPEEGVKEIPLFAYYDELKFAQLDLLAQVRDELVKLNKFFEEKAK